MLVAFFAFAYVCYALGEVLLLIDEFFHREARRAALIIGKLVLLMAVSSLAILHGVEVMLEYGGRMSH